MPHFPPFPELRALRIELHRHPELSHQEHVTQGILEKALSELGLEPRRVAHTGLVADVVGDPGGPVVCLRGDIDGLPLHEDSGVDFPSQNPGVMHACGHDVHAAALWGAAAHLLEDPPRGTVRLLFQPAEEAGTGARACVEDGALVGVDAVLGGHVDLRYPVGTVAVQPGAMCASTDGFRIEVQGRSGHGARPHQGRDALLAASQIVVALQGLVAREVEPGNPAVLTIGRMQAGERDNILAGEAVMEGTLRTQDPDVRAYLRDAVARVAHGVGQGAGCAVKVVHVPGNAAILNDPELTVPVATALQGLLGPEHVVPLAHRNMGGEDFSQLTIGRPGVYVRWGAAGPGSADAPAHSPGFRVDEGVLELIARGLEAMARAAMQHVRKEAS